MQRHWHQRAKKMVWKDSSYFDVQDECILPGDYVVVRDALRCGIVIASVHSNQEAFASSMHTQGARKCGPLVYYVMGNNARMYGPLFSSDIQLGYLPRS